MHRLSDASLLLTAVLLLLATAGCAGLGGDASRLPVPGPRPDDRLFAGHEVFALTLEFDQRAVFKERKGESSYHPAVLEYRDTAGEQLRLDLQVRTRGHFRRDRETCNFPPLRLNFARKQTMGSAFAKQDKLKLVTHCKRSYEHLVLQEYLLYRVYHLLTQKSFRVRLVEITYVDSAGRRNPTSRYAFFIEDLEVMAERNGFTPVEEPVISLSSLDPEELSRVEVFQYMVGNTDWSVLRGPEGEGCCHNTKPIRGSDGRVVSVPYDFDITGAVNPSYGEPNPEFGLRSLRQRLYRGFCRPERFLELTLDAFRARRGDIYSLYRAEERLDPRRVAATLRFFDSFYETIGDPELVKKDLLRECRGGPSDS